MAAEREELDDLTSEDEDYGSNNNSGTNVRNEASQLLAASEPHNAGNTT